MAPTIYGSVVSPPVRAVYMTAAAIGLELNCIEIDLRNRGNYSPDYLKINPKHTIPTMVDGGLILTDSHAITTYLVGKYSNSALYPKFLHQRAHIDEMLHFDSTAVFSTLKSIVFSLIHGHYQVIPAEVLEKVYEVYSVLEKILAIKDFVAGKEVSVADYHLFTSIKAANVLIPLAEDQYPNINKWLSMCSKTSPYDHTEGFTAFRQIFERFLPNN